MARSNLEKAIAEAAQGFALQVIEAVKGATLQELIALQQEGKPKRRGRKPGPKPKAAAKKAAKKAPAKKKRVVKNYPKCAYPRCNKNRFPRGKGFCGEHWKAFEAGKIKSAESYKKKAKPKSKAKAKKK
jgi:hypothetical protein